MTETYGISNITLERMLDQYIIKSGETIAIGSLREGIEKILRENNIALMEDVNQMIEDKMRK